MSNTEILVVKSKTLRTLKLQNVCVFFIIIILIGNINDVLLQGFVPMVFCSNMYILVLQNPFANMQFPSSLFPFQ